MTKEQMRAKRNAHKLTHRVLADLLGTTETTVSRLENGHQPIDTRWSSHLELLFAKIEATPKGWSHAS